MHARRQFGRQLCAALLAPLHSTQSPGSFSVKVHVACLLDDVLGAPPEILDGLGAAEGQRRCVLGALQVAHEGAHKLVRGLPTLRDLVPLRSQDDLIALPLERRELTKHKSAVLRRAGLVMPPSSASLTGCNPSGSVLEGKRASREPLTDSTCRAPRAAGTSW